MSQHTTEALRMVQNILVIGLVPKGVQILEIFKVIAEDISNMATNGVEMYVSNPNSTQRDALESHSILVPKN